MSVTRLTRVRINPFLGIDLTQLAADLSSLRLAMGAQQTFAGARPEATQPVRVALTACFADLTSALAAAEAIMANPNNAVAGVVGGQDGAVNVDTFWNYFAVASQEPELVDLDNFLERMAANISLGGTACSDTTNLSGPVV